MSRTSTRARLSRVFGTAGGTMVSLDASGLVTHLEFKIPTRGIMGLKNRILNVTHGDGVFYPHVPGVRPLRGRHRRPQERRA